jgi:hypothetical protein
MSPLFYPALEVSAVLHKLRLHLLLWIGKLLHNSIQLLLGPSTLTDLHSPIQAPLRYNDCHGNNTRLQNP